MRKWSPDRLKGICEAGEAAARECILSKLDWKLIHSLDIEVASEAGDGITFNVDVSLELEPGIEIDLDRLTDEASDAALSAIDKEMRVRRRA